MIAWKYIDKNAATIAAIRDYNNMSVIIDNTPDAVKEIYENMTALRTANITEQPRVINPQAGESRLVEQIDKIDLLNERYHAAVEYMSWFRPAWEVLTEKEKYILQEFYMIGTFRDGARNRLAEEFNYAERHIDRLRSKALQRLKILLFG